MTMNNIEMAYQKAIQKEANLKDCKECKFFALNNNENNCNFDSHNKEDCSLLVQRLHLLP